MKNILKLITASALSATLLSSCIKEVEPTNGAVYDQVKDRIDAMVAGIPGAMIQPAFAGLGEHNDFGYPSLIIARESMGEDFVHDGNLNYDWFYDYADNTSWGYTYGIASHFWNSYWPWVKACNDVLKTVKATNGDPAYLGIAYAYRAFFYLDMVRLYEFKENAYTSAPNAVGLAIPIVTEDTTEQMAANNPRATVDEVYEQIFSDLKNAEKYLESYARTEPTMPNLAVVYGLYARAYLERGEKSDDNYAKAAEYARKAIDASGCTPLTQDQWEDPTNGFNNMSSQNSWMLGLPLPSEQVANLFCFTAHMSTEESWTNYGWNVCRGINKALYDQISNKDFRKHSWLDPDRSFYNYKSCRPDGATHFAESLRDYANIKFRPAGGNYSDYRTGGAADHPLMRVEEMYLIEAEAAGMVNLNEGKRLLNEFMKYRILDGSYNCSSIASEEQFQKEVILQKRIEFWGEGVLFFDYKRLGLGITRGYAGTNHQPNYRYNCNKIAPWWNFCIPRTEIQNNSGIPQSLNNPDPSSTVSLWMN